MWWETVEVKTLTASEVNLKQSKLIVNIAVVFPARPIQRDKDVINRGDFYVRVYRKSLGEARDQGVFLFYRYRGV
jgi:hypothetical protein